MARKNRCRTGKFPWEEGAQLTLESLRGENDWQMSADCRCSDYQGIVDPWIALCSLENWGQEARTPDGLADGDTGRYEEKFVPLEELGAAADLFGRPISDDFSAYDVEDHLEEYWQDEIAILAKAEQEYPEDDLDDVFWDSTIGGFRMTDFLAEDMAEEPEEFVPVTLEGDSDHLWEEPTWMKNSHWFSSGRTQDSEKELRMMNFSGSCQCGKRGNNRYKDRRLARVRMSRQKFRRAVAKAKIPVYYDIDQPRRRLPQVLF